MEIFFIICWGFALLLLALFSWGAHIRLTQQERAIRELALSLRNTNYKVNGTMSAFKGDEEIESTVNRILNGKH